MMPAVTLMMDAILYFDTEDTVSPPEAGTDDIILWLADLLTAHGLRGCFHIIGDKARLLEARGRADVIHAMQRHDVSSHFNAGSAHPMTVEQVAAADWHQGVRLTLENEQKGFDDIQRILGRCSALTRHGSSYAPQIVRAAGLCGKMYHGVPFALPGHRIFWFCGTLCTSQIGLIRTTADKPAVGKFEEDTFADDERFDEQLRQFIPALEACCSRWDFTALFGCHPLRLVLTRFCDNYAAGRNASPLVPVPVRTPQDLQRVKRNFTKYIQALSQMSGLRCVGMDELAVRYSRRLAHVTDQQLEDYARRVANSTDVPLDDRFSPAEMLAALARSVIEHHQVGRWPARINRQEVIGPTTDLPCSLAGETFSVSSIIKMAHSLHDHVSARGELPACTAIGQAKLPPADVLGLFAQYRVDLSPGSNRACYQVMKRHPWPALVDENEADIRQMARWRILHPSTDFSSIAHHTQLQGWSLAPAHAG